MALLAVLALSTFLDERLLDWEEFRILPDAPQAFSAIGERDPTLEFSERISLWIWSNAFLNHIEALRLLSWSASIASLALACVLLKRFAGQRHLIVVLLFTLGLNVYFNDFARWGIAYYSTGVLYAMCMVPLFHRIHLGTATNRVRMLLAIGSLASVYVSQREGAFVLASGAVAVLIGHAVCRRPGGPILRTKAADLCCILPFFISFAVTGWSITVANLPWLFEGGPNQLHDPKVYRAHLYFRNAGAYPKSFEGFLHFYFNKTRDLLFDLFTPVGALHEFVRYGLIVLFFVGLVFSVAGIARRRNENREFLAVFIGAGVLVCVALNLLNLNPYGNVRYAMFLFFPVAAMTAVGAADVTDSIGKLFGKRSEAAGHFIGLALGIVLCVVAVCGFFRESEIRIQRGREYAEIVAAMRSDSDLFLVSERYTRAMTYYAPANMHRVVGISENSEVIGARLAEPSVERVTVITLYPTADDENPALEPLVAAAFEPYRQACLHCQDDRVLANRLFKYDITARQFRRKE